MRVITFLIGGSKFSGAEKRLIKTAALLADKHHEMDVNLFVRKSLFNQIGIGSDGKEIERLMGNFNDIYIINDTFQGKRSLIMYFFGLLKLLFMPHLFWKKHFHIALFTPCHFPMLIFSNRIYFEITSPDIAKTRYFPLMALFFRKKLSLIAVSESVYLYVIQKFYDNFLFKSIPIQSRAVAFSDISVLAESDLAKKENLAIYAHRLIERKNPIVATLSFAFLAKKYPNWRFCVYGDGPLADQIKAICSSGPDNLMYMGYTRDIVKSLEESKIFISVIEPDSYPSQSVIEAMAKGNAIILGSCGSGPQKFIDGNGFSVDINELSIISAMEQLICCDKEDFQLYGKASIKLMNDRFSLNSYLADSYRLYF